MILPIFLYGTDELRETAKEADLSDKEGITTLVNDMYETMRHADGCGIAARCKKHFFTHSAVNCCNIVVLL